MRLFFENMFSHSRKCIHKKSEKCSWNLKVDRTSSFFPQSMKCPIKLVVYITLEAAFANNEFSFHSSLSNDFVHRRWRNVTKQAQVGTFSCCWHCEKGVKRQDPAFLILHWTGEKCYKCMLGKARKSGLISGSNISTRDRSLTTLTFLIPQTAYDADRNTNFLILCPKSWIDWRCSSGWNLSKLNAIHVKLNSWSSSEFKRISKEIRKMRP